MGSDTRVVFLPGAGGAASFWHPVAERLPGDWSTTLLNWPGAGQEPHDPRVTGFDDLITLAAAGLDDRTDLVAQSMGGVVAIGLALRHPDQIRRLVLVATSGGVQMGRFTGLADWRDEYRREYPRAASWVSDQRPDYGDQIAAVRQPTLLIWGDSDPISPVAVGEHLHSLLPDSVLHVLPGGTHSLAVDQPDAVATLIAGHLS
jgi:pimeloyl-ACP methyl ester carboxylesterase